ncbi:MAG TPA: hypothetical protein VMG82_17100 [Candidatus Sulfotelmatobacter sp.]|nr:hypothetical protein [Candidatus Sulfotelmatobacter sp.]
MMRTVFAETWTKLVLCAAMTMGLCAGAFASCGDSLAAIAAGRAIVSSAVGKQLAAASTTGTATSSSIVGLWYIQFSIGGQPIQEAFQNWNLGGTEVHNPNVDPRTSAICLGTWIKTASGALKLAHRVWSYDTNGNFQGTIHLSETVRLNHNGNAQTGTFQLDIYDPSGNFVTEVAGDVSGQRIRVE